MIQMIISKFEKFKIGRIKFEPNEIINLRKFSLLIKHRKT